MPNYEFTNTHLVIGFKPLEKIAALTGDLSIPWESVRGATEDFGAVPGELGIRAPGTGWPGSIATGTFYKRSRRQFVWWLKGHIPVIVELKNHRFERLILGSSDPKSLAQQINSRAAAN
jgi:hypothetical protein